jgi:hypothetical protein
MEKKQELLWLFFPEVFTGFSLLAFFHDNKSLMLSSSFISLLGDDFDTDMSFDSIS